MKKTEDFHNLQQGFLLAHPIEDRKTLFYLLMGPQVNQSLYVGSYPLRFEVGEVTVEHLEVSEFLLGLPVLVRCQIL